MKLFAEILGLQSVLVVCAAGSVLGIRFFPRRWHERITLYSGIYLMYAFPVLGATLITAFAFLVKKW